MTLVLATALMGACSSGAPHATIENVDCGSTRTYEIATLVGDAPVTVTTNCYDVEGSTTEQVRASMDAGRRLPTEVGDGVDAATRWDFWIDWEYGARGSDCLAATLSPAIDVTFTYPRLNADGDEPQDLVRRWNDYISSLETHEEVHKQNGIDALIDAINGIAELQAPTCAEYETLADARIAEATAAGNSADLAYDAETDHGRSQGARFP
jgi:predicted secreted Zn-dependent protease